MDVIDLAAPGYQLGCLGSFLGVPWDHFGDHWIHFRTPGSPKSEPKSSRRPFGLPRSSFQEFGTDFGGQFPGLSYSCTFLNGFLKPCFWILRQLHVFDEFYVGFVDRRSVLKDSCEFHGFQGSGFEALWRA